MYRERGYTDEEIKIIENRLFSDPKLLLEDMAHKELGINPNELEEPIGNAFVMGTSYVVGGIVPVIPYLFFPVGTAMPVSIGSTMTALFIFGSLKARFVKQVWWKGGIEMLGIAGVATLAGYMIGNALAKFFGG